MLEATTATTVRIKGHGDRESYSKELANSNVAYIICVELDNNEFFYKKKIPTAIAFMMLEVLASRGKMKATCIIADKLQRHNYNLEELEEKDASGSNSKYQRIEKIGYEIANSCKDYAAAINKLILSGVSPENAVSLEVIRWDTLLQRPEYTKHQQTVERLFNDDYGFKKSIQKTVDDYRKRLSHSNQASHGDNPSGKQAYVLEETAMMGVLADMKFDAIIYPARCPAALDAAIKSPLIGGSKINWCQLNYNEKSDLTSDAAVRPLIRSFYSGKVSGLDFFGNKTIRKRCFDTSCLELAENFKPHVTPSHLSSSLVSPLFGPTMPPSDQNSPFASFGIAIHCLMMTNPKADQLHLFIALLQQQMLHQERRRPSNTPRRSVEQVSHFLPEPTATTSLISKVVSLKRSNSLPEVRRGHGFFPTTTIDDNIITQQSTPLIATQITPHACNAFSL